MPSTTAFRRFVLLSALALLAIAATPSQAHPQVDVARYAALAELDTTGFEALDERDLDERDDDDCEDDEDTKAKVNVKAAQTGSKQKSHATASSQAANPAQTPSSSPVPQAHPGAFAAQDNAPVAVANINGAIVFAPSFAAVGATLFAGALLL